MMQDPLGVFARRDATETQLRETAAMLGAVSESPAFWMAIAADPSYGGYHRACSVNQLFRRHVLPGSNLSALRQLLAPASWLSDADVTLVTALGGKLPVRWSLEDTIFVVCAAPDGTDRNRACAYLRVRGRVEETQVTRLLHGETTDEATREAVILEVGLSGPCSSLPEHGP